MRKKIEAIIKKLRELLPKPKPRPTPKPAPKPAPKPKPKPVPKPKPPPVPATHRFGIDFAWGTIPIVALKAHGVSFVVRYLSHDPSKNLHDNYADDLTANGIDIVVIWETTADRAAQGALAGGADAREALAQATACGMPKGRPIYFAVDFDAGGLQIEAYFRGVARVLSPAGTGVYGGYKPVSYLMEHGVVKFGWQTYAWSSGRWFSRAQLFQYSNGHTIGGVEVDYDHSASAADFGQWRA
jgi:hypothetical protein